MWYQITIEKMGSVTPLSLETPIHPPANLNNAPSNPTLFYRIPIHDVQNLLKNQHFYYFLGTALKFDSIKNGISISNQRKRYKMKHSKRYTLAWFSPI